MSAPLSETVVLFRQRMLACAGFYKGELDGRWGDQTNKADAAFYVDYMRTQKLLGVFDHRSESNILTMLPKAQVKARQFLRVCASRAGFTYQIIGGTRTYAEQDALFEQKPRVTKAPGGSSNHNFCIAWDTGIFQDGHYLIGATPAEEHQYRALAADIKAHISDLEWGGDWKSFKDEPHYQLATGKTLAQVRAAFEAGRPFV